MDSLAKNSTDDVPWAGLDPADEELAEPDHAGQNPSDEDPGPPDPHSTSDRQRHRLLLGLALFVLVMTFLLDVRSDDRVVVRGLPDFPLPHSCTMYRVWGVKCPGCGLTRSFIRLAKGDVAGSFHSHHLGWAMALLVGVQIPYRAACLWRPAHKSWKRYFPRWAALTFLAAMFVNWVVDRLREL